MKPRMHYDDAAWEKSEEVSDSWAYQLFEPDILNPVGNFLVQHHSPHEPDQFSILGKGAFNLSLRMRYEDQSSAVIRFSLPGAAMFPEEKTRTEVATMRYIQDQTSIPVPFIYHWGSRKDSPLELGPFIIMDFIEHHTSMYDALNWPGCPTEERGVLDSNISELKLEFLYRELASVLLRLSKPSLPRIGSLHQVDDFTWEVADRPLSMPMNELVRLGSLPQSELPRNIFDTASSYFEALADLHIAHLTYQRNDAIDSAEDCRRKYIARYLFRKLAREKRLTRADSPFENGPFKLWCDDFRPANVLLNESLKIVGVVDWEFTYAAPVELSHAPPWWLLIEKPEYWPDGLEDWCKVYEARLQTFLKAMAQCEDQLIMQGRLKENERLSGLMRDSWDSGDFWISYAARNNFAFDAIYWQKIDQPFFGATSCPVEDVWKQRVDLLDSHERYEMERLVDQKTAEVETRELQWDPDAYTIEYAETMKMHRERKEGDTTVDNAAKHVEINDVETQARESAD